MKYLLIILLTLFIATTVGSIVIKDTGYVLLSISGWKIETSVVLFFIILFIIFLLLYFLIRSLVRAWQLPEQIRTWKVNKKQYLSEKNIIDGLINMSEGEWGKAEKNFCKAASNSKSPYIIYLFAARAAHAMNSLDKSNEYLRFAHNHEPNAGPAIGLTQAELQLNQKQIVQALATLNNLQEKWPEHLLTKKMLLEAYTALNDWQEVLKLLRSIEKEKLYTHDEIEIKKHNAYVGLLKDAGISDDRKKLDNIWEEIPRKLKYHHHLIEVYVREKLKFKDISDSEVILKNAIKKKWDRKLVRLYGLVIGIDPDKQLATAESWLNQYPDDPILLLSLGRICVRNSLWSKAKTYLQKSLDIRENSDTLFEFANLYQKQSDYKQATVYYEKGLRLDKVRKRI